MNNRTKNDTPPKRDDPNRLSYFIFPHKAALAVAGHTEGVAVGLTRKASANSKKIRTSANIANEWTSCKANEK